jgi:sugar lactone lactonase YvrE
MFDAAGNLYVSDAGNHTVRRISPEGVVSTVAGLAGQAGDADGAGAAARFSTPGDLALAPDGSVYVADIGNRAVRRLAPDGTVTTFVRAEGTASMAEPTALAIGPGGRLLYIADRTQNVLWRARLP